MTIKIRVWDGQYMHYEPRVNIKIYFSDDLTLKGYETISNKELVIMQYTGLKDKSGKEIYEGDILIDEFTGRAFKMVVKIEYGSCFGASDNSVISSYNFIDDEFIGNIYENPELLTI